MTVTTKSSDRSELIIDDPSLDVDAGTYTLHWKDDESGRAALLFFGHLVRRSNPARGQALLAVARQAGGIGPAQVDVDDLVDFC